MAMDGTEDGMLFQASDNDEDAFEGFSAGDVEAAAQLEGNLAAPVEIDSLEYSEPSEQEEDSENDYDDPNSPGH